MEISSLIDKLMVRNVKEISQMLSIFLNWLKTYFLMVWFLRLISLFTLKFDHIIVNSKQ